MKGERHETDLQRDAAGRECQIRIPGVCRPHPEDCSLCHAPLHASYRGGDQKAPDALAAFGCTPCHDEVDRRTRYVETQFARLCFYEGVLRTQAIWIAEGKLKW